MPTNKHYRSPNGSPLSFRVSDVPADQFENLKTAIFHLHDGSWPHRISSSTVLEFLIWWFHATRDEKKTEVRMKDFRPKTKQGPSGGYQSDEGGADADFSACRCGVGY